MSDNQHGIRRHDRGANTQMHGIITGLQIARNAINDPRQRAKAGGGLGWETGRDVVDRLMGLAEQDKLWPEVRGEGK